MDDIVIRGPIAGTHDRPNTRRIVARPVGESEVRIIEQMAHFDDPLSREPYENRSIEEWEDVETFLTIESDTAITITEGGADG